LQKLYTEIVARVYSALWRLLDSRVERPWNATSFFVESGVACVSRHGDPMQAAASPQTCC
jgi:hypothetical protein